MVSAQSRYTDISEREGRSGPMVLLKVETTYTNQDDETLARVDDDGDHPMRPKTSSSGAVVSQGDTTAGRRSHG